MSSQQDYLDSLSDIYATSSRSTGVRPGGLSGYRKAFNQGLSMGWSDEVAAKKRAMETGVPYEQALAQVRNEYSQFAQDNPIGAPLMEFAGGIAPSIAAMFVPGGQAAGAVSGVRTLGALGQAAKAIIGGRSTGQNVLRATGTGTATGAISGAGSTEGDRTIGAIFGGGTGALLAPVAQLAPGLVGAGYRSVSDRFRSSPDVIEAAAARRINKALGDMTPQEMMQRINEDALIGIPSMPANVNRGLLGVTETMAQRPGRSSEIIGESIGRQREDMRDRVVGQAQSNLSPNRYFDDRDAAVEALRTGARPYYQEAYSVGQIDDPVINEMLRVPQFRQAFERAQSIADLEKANAAALGEDLSDYTLQRVYRSTGEFDPAAVKALRDMGIPEDRIPEYLAKAQGDVMSMEEITLPDVRTLDYIKRGLDDMIDQGYRGVGMSIPQAKALKDLRTTFVNRIDDIVPEYRQARNIYGGDLEVRNALDLGFEKFNSLQPEQLTRMFSKFGDAEKDAFRTGAARHLYDVVMGPSTDADYAGRIIRSPKTQEKLRAIFPSDAQYNLFETALMRESELFRDASRALAGSATARRTAGLQEFEADPLMDAASALATQGFERGLVSGVMNMIGKGTISDDLAAKMAEWLSSNDPQKIAAVVQKLEQYQATAIPTFGGRRAASTGFVGGVQGMSGEAGLPIRDEGDEE